MIEKIRPTIICPECGVEWRDEAPGSVKCPNPECQQSFEVDDYGDAIQYTVPIKCPNCDETWQDDAPGIVECPTCKASFEVDDCGNEIVRSPITCPICDRKIYDFASGIVKCFECGHEFEVDKQDNLILQEIDEPVIKENIETTPKSWQTNEVQLARYDETRYVHVTAKDAVTGGIFTVYLKNISENKNGIVGTEVDKSGHEIKDKEGFDGRKHIILKGAILKQQEVRLNQKYGEMEVHCQAIGEKIGTLKR